MPKFVVPLLALTVRVDPPLAFRLRTPPPALLVIAEPATCVCVPLMFSVPAPIFESVRAAALVIGPVRESELFVTSTDAFPIVIVEARLIVLAVLRVEFEDSVRVPGEAPEAIVLLPPEMNSVDAFVVRLLSLFVPPVRLKVVGLAAVLLRFVVVKVFVPPLMLNVTLRPPVTVPTVVLPLLMVTVRVSGPVPPAVPLLRVVRL